MHQPNEFQQKLFAEIFANTAGKSKITADLMAILGCSRASLYRKRVGSSPLTTDELVKLANHFSISLDALRKKEDENSDVVVCTTLPPIKDYGDIYFYLENTLVNLDQALSQPTAQLYFVAKELPLHRYMRYEGLSAFRYYLWVIENLKRYDKFDPQNVPNELITKGQRIAELSDRIKMTEYWLTSGFDNILGQITYAFSAGRISERIKKKLVDELHSLLDGLIDNIRTEETFGERPYRMILCHYLTLSDGALIEINPQQSQLLFSYSSINYLKSSNPKLIDAFKRGLRYHRLEGQVLSALEDEAISMFEKTIRVKINSI